MSVGKSGRIVIEIEPELKQELYEALSKESKSLKSWFLGNVETFLEGRGQLVMSFGEISTKRGDTSDEI